MGSTATNKQPTGGVKISEIEFTGDRRGHRQTKLQN